MALGIHRPAAAGQIQVPELSRKLARFLQVKQSSVSPSISPDIIPVIVMGDLSRETIEDIEVERPMIDSIVLTSLVTDIATLWHIGNPVGSGTVMVFEHLIASANITARWDLVLRTGVGIPAGSTLGTPKPRNTQTNNATAISGNSVAAWGAVTNAIAGGGNFSSRYIAANTNADMLVEPFILTPGFSLRVQRAGFIAGEQQLTPVWRERRLVA